MAGSAETVRDSTGPRGRRKRRGPFAFALTLGAFASAVACSLVLQEESLPCTSDADCAKFAGATCDLAAQHCVAGTLDGASGIDVLAPAADAPALDGPSDGAALESSVPQDGTAPGDDAGDVSVPPPDTGVDADAGDAGPSIDWTALTKYLDNLYNANEKLLQTTVASGMYITNPDNALAQRAFLYLPTPDATKSNAILARLQSYKICGCSTGPHDATINHQFDPAVTKGGIIALDPSGNIQGTPTDVHTAGGTCTASDAATGPVCPPSGGVMHEDRPPSWSPDICNPTPPGGYSLTGWNTSGAGSGYADILALQILSYRNQKFSTAVLWASLVSKWDGVGINDAANLSDGFYSTYKLALFKLAQRAIGGTLPDGGPVVGVDPILIAAQGPNGGIRASYTSPTAFVDQVANAETTALVVLAFQLPQSEL
jgi:hypothetical protein